MGMAASQARYLGLTARKTNVEYEGQQVNQARTALANQSANLFNRLLSLQVPTPPSTTDFTKLEYSYIDGTNGEIITDMTPLYSSGNTQGEDTYNYSVTHYHNAEVYQGQQVKLTNPHVVLDGSTTPSTPTNVGNYELTKFTYYTDIDGSSLSDSEKELQKEIQAQFEQISTDWKNKSKFPQIPTTDTSDFTNMDGSTVQIYYYSAADGRRYFATSADLIASGQSAPDAAHPIDNQTIKLPTYYAESSTQRIEKTQNALVDFDGSGRAISLKYEDSSVVYTLNAETSTDENAYNDAMNQYTYDMAVYEKEIQDINAKTAKIQEEDRTLELRLKQLDTEQEALQTEMEAVKKVIDKNIENTFKTFE